MRYGLEIEFEEAAFGKEAEITVALEDDCGECGGTGSLNGLQQTCSTCGGQGQVYQSRGFIRLATTCPTCRGEGRMVTDPCETCAGAGRIKRERTLSVKIRPGVDNGSRLRVRGGGEGGRLGGPPGDLILEIYVKSHPFFERDGDNVICRIPVSMVDAALGAQIDVPTIHGEKPLKVSKGTNSGDILRLKGEGFPNPHSGRRGDQLMQIQVLTPANLSKRQEELLREFAELEEEKNKKKSWTERLKEALG